MLFRGAGPKRRSRGEAPERMKTGVITKVKSQCTISKTDITKQTQHTTKNQIGHITITAAAEAVTEVALVEVKATVKVFVSQKTRQIFTPIRLLTKHTGAHVSRVLRIDDPTKSLSPLILLFSLSAWE